MTTPGVLPASGAPATAANGKSSADTGSEDGEFGRAEALGDGGPEQVQQDITWGKYLVQVSACGACHGSVAGRAQAPLSGGRKFRDGFGYVYAANITPDATGIAGWQWPEVARAIRASIDRKGNPISIDVHAQYRWLSDLDARAISQYLLHQPPVKNRVERRELGLFDRRKWGIFSRHRDVEGYVPRLVRSETPFYGRYLAYNVTGCYACHTPHAGIIFSEEPFSGASSSSQSLFDSVGEVLERLKNEATGDTRAEVEALLSEEARTGVRKPKKLPTAAVTPSTAPSVSGSRPAWMNPKHDHLLVEGELPQGGPDIRASSAKGLSGWTQNDVVTYLQTGRTARGMQTDGRLCPWPNFAALDARDMRALALFLLRQ